VEKVFFWREIDYDDYDEPIIKNLVKVLNPFSVAWMKFLDFVHPQINIIKIHRYDTWNMDSTLADIILPMLKQLKETKHGSPYVEDEDVPEELQVDRYVEWSQQLRFTFEDDEQYINDSWNLAEHRWNYILDEMIFAFEHHVDDTWEEAYSSGKMDIKHVPCEWYEDGKPKLYAMEHGPDHTYQRDHEGLRKVHERMTNGFRLFGKYYQGLWD
jgi:hypothetical protein